MNIDRKRILPGSRVLCAVSGGADSVCLLHLLWSGGDLELTAAHFEHGLRGEESLRDARFVEDFCRERGIPLVLEHGDAAAYAREKGLGVEEAARELRYAFLERKAETLGCDWIVTAHNADDNAETLLLNLCRGAGAAGLSGIPPRRGKILRPLLNCSRAEIEAYLREHGLEHVEDSSNESDEYRRNVLRHRVTPVLRELNPRFAEAAGRTARLLRQDEDCLATLTDAFIRREHDGESVPIPALLALHPAVASRVLRRLCPKSLGQEHVETALAFCAGEGLAFLDLPGLRLRREQGRLYFAERPTQPIPDRPLRIGERLEIPEAGLAILAEEALYAGEIYDLFKTYTFKSESICGTLYCTGRRPGDRYRPKGRGCGKSLHDLFREDGLTQSQRDARLVLRDDKGILAVLGYPADERVTCAPGDSCLRVQILDN
jgi:tRNA(Ile)-lysidine synthase